MRILHLSSEKGWRGGEQQLAYLLGDLARLDVKNVLAIKKGSALENFSKERKLTHYPVSFSNSVDLVSALQITKICRREKIDLVHLHSSKAHGVGVLSSLCGNRVPMVLSRRVAFVPGSNFLSKWKYNSPQIKKIICVSEKVQHIMSRYGGGEKRCVTVYSGIDLSKFDGIKVERESVTSEFGIDPKSSLIVTVGAIDAAKDHFTFVDTIKRLVGSYHVTGLIVGDGPLRTRLQEYVKGSGLEKYIVFAGQRKDVGRLLLSSDIFMMTSKEEGLGTSLLDAFLARLPVVATSAGGIPEIVINMQTGLLAPVGDSAKLSDQIIQLLTEPQLREVLVERALSFVRKFSKERTSSETHKIYQEVLGL